MTAPATYSSARPALGFEPKPAHHYSCGSPLVLALVDSLRLRGPEISGEVGLVAMKVLNDMVLFCIQIFADSIAT